jgi:hypothetical protein
MPSSECIPEFIDRRVPVAAFDPRPRTLHRLKGPDGSVAEIRDQRVAGSEEAIEWSLFLNGRLLTSRLFPQAHVDYCLQEIGRVFDDLISAGWREESASTSPS